MGGTPCSICGDAAHYSVQGEAACSACLTRAFPGVDMPGLLDSALAGATPAGYCPSCGLTEKEYKATRLLGCAFCYVVFRPGGK
jgi:protein-arginine kinase activator protein McsA